jgi:serine/threonine protein kinase
MGVVYLAADPDGRSVAIKLVHAFLSGNPEFSARFRSEVERARQVPSFCTAEVLDADLEHEPPYLVVEYVDGPSLFEVVQERGPLTVSNLHSVAVGVATALTGIHGAGVIHRDLKPQNVLLAPGTPKVIDFGIARAFEASSSYTRTGHMVGTVSYMAPERFSAEPGTPLTPAMDIFSWGCVVAYAGTGQTPFHGDSPEATAARILTQPPHLGDLPEPLRGLVELAVVKNPADRPTARELLNMLVSGDPTAPTRTIRPRPPGLPPAIAALLPELPARRPAAPADRPARSRSTGMRNDLSDLVDPSGPEPRPLPMSSPDRNSPDRNSSDRSSSGHSASGHSASGHSSGSRSHGLPSRRRPPGRLLRGPVRGSRWLVPATVLAVAVVITAGVWLGRGLTSANADGTQTGASSPASASARTLSSVVEPSGGTIIFRDSLTTQGIWNDDKTGSGAGQCVVRGKLRVALTDRVEDGVHRCSGPTRDVQGDFGVTVTTTLESPAACAAIWFHWADQNGQVLRVCRTGIALDADAPDDHGPLGTFRAGTPVEVNEPMVLHLVVRNGAVQLWRDGVYAGSVPLPETLPHTGRILIGVSEKSGDAPPPYTVTFADLEIRTLGG